MLPFILALALQMPLEKTYCPEINMINIDLRHAIDRGVFKRTRKRCQRLYSKSPCLIKLEQISKGAFYATCGNPRILAAADSDVAADIDVEILPNCSAAIFERQPPEARKEVPDQRLGQALLFCQDLGLDAPKPAN